MTRVAFVMNPVTLAWQGGANQVRNLFHALRLAPEAGIDPVLVVSPRTPEKELVGLTGGLVLRTLLVERPGRGLRRALSSVFDRDLLLERFLRRGGVELMSHFEQLGASRMPVIGWLTDFQHHRLPALFSPEEIAARDRQFRNTIERSAIVLLSSYDAQSDLRRFAPQALAKSRVLHFVSGHSETAAPLPLPDLQARFGFQGPFFHLPNQFWAHKNHRLVVDALARLGKAGTPQLVLATGSTGDYRHRQYFDDLMRHVHASDVADSFRVLGVVPYDVMTSLMRHAVAVINPSLFEGWSTSVEECKTFDRRILLSDIPVHREQAPRHGVYFPPDDVDALATAMLQAREAGPVDPAGAPSREDLEKRFRDFGLRYAAIVHEILRT